MAKLGPIPCVNCGHALQLGDWPFCPHGRSVVSSLSFKSYWDPHLSTDGKPVHITSPGQRRRLMRTQWDGDFQARFEERS